jgi:carbamate kinase
MSNDQTWRARTDQASGSVAGSTLSPAPAARVTRPATPRPHPPTLIAIGGNSLLDPLRPPTVANQFAVTARAVIPIADLVERGEHLVLTHGNGPQVGFMQLRVEVSKQHIHEVPLDSLVADSQGAIGYMIQRDLREELERRGLRAEIATIVTEVEVDPGDDAFSEPTKPIGKFYSADEAAALKAERGWEMIEDSHRGWRRVVASPAPHAIVQIDTIRRLVSAGVIVIACGGGGIPVMRGPDQRLYGLEAVVDKDRASALLAAELDVRRMIITTGVDALYRDYLTEHRTRLATIGTQELHRMVAEHQFPPGSMGPKIEAALRFLDCGGEEVVICHPDALIDAFAGRAGTTIRKDRP